MKLNYFVVNVLSIIFIISVISCKKSTTNTPPIALSEWTYNGITYKDSSAVYFASSSELLASDNNGNYVRIILSAITKPTTGSTLTVINYVTGFSNAIQCTVHVGNSFSSNPIQPYSIGKAGDVVTLSVSSSGKLTATFTNISVKDGSITKTVSGTIVEQ